MSFQKCVTKYRNYLNFENGDDVVADIDGGTVEEDKGRGKSEISEEKFAEINEVQQLDFDMIPVSRRSEVVRKLELKRKIRHESLLKKFADDLNELNLKIEENVTISSEEVKAHIKNDKSYLTEILKSLNVPEVASYHESIFLDIQKKADGMKSRQLNLIHGLYRELNEMEDLRAKENERIFRSMFTKFDKNGQISSYDVQVFAEQEALKMNQISLNNRRCFEDLRLKLVLGCEHAYKSFMDEVFCLRDKWIRYNGQEALDFQRSEINPVIVLPEPEMRMELKGHELICSLTPDKCYTVVNQREWYRNVKDVVGTIENYKMGIDELFIKLKQAIGRSMSNECDDVRRALTSLDGLQFEVRWIQPIFFGLFGETCDNVREFDKFWQDRLKKAENIINDIGQFLLNFGELWTCHNRRICESKILVLKAVEKAEDNNRLLLQDLEANLNLNLDMLRQESNEQKIEALHNTVKTSLDVIRDRLGSNYMQETSIAEEFHEMMDLEADVLSSDVNELIHTKFSSWPNDEDDRENQFLPEIADTVLGALIRDFSSRMDKLKLSKSEIIEDLEIFSNNAKERLKWRAEEWSKNKIREISMKHQTQLEIHNKRYERVKIQIYEVRLEEIRVHKQVFDEHKAGVEDIRKTLADGIENLREKGMEQLEKFKVKVTSAVEGLKKEERAEVVRYVQSQMIREKSDIINDFKSKLELVQGEIELKISSIQKSNMRFMKSIKLFHEYGNYDCDEAKTYVDALENLDREVSTEGKNMVKDLNKKESQINQKATEIFDSAVRTLSQLYEELKFHSDVKNLINLYKTNFQDLEKDLKSDFDLLVKEHDRLLTRCSDEDTYLSDELDDAWIIVIHSMCKNISNIFYELEPSEWEYNAALGGLPMSENDSSEVRALCSNVKYEKFTKPSIQPDGSTKDLSDELFEITLLEGKVSSFVNKSCSEILRYTSQIQALGSIFYKKTGNKSLIRKDLIRTNYEDFGRNVLQIFRLFAAQSEGVWLKTVESIFPLLGHIKTSFKIYTERRMREYSEKVVAALGNYELNFTKCMVRNECNFFNAFKIFDKRLLPLHGYPQNRALLESLQEEVVQRTAELEVNWESFIKKYKSELKHYRALYNVQYPEWQKLKFFYSYGENILFSDVMGQDVLDCLDGVIEKRGFVKKVENIGGKEHLSNAGLGASNTGDVGSSKYTYEILLNNDMHLSNIKKIMEKETADDGTENRMMLGSELHPGRKLLQESVDFDVFAEPYITEMDARYKEVKELINSKSDRHKEIIFDWLDEWKMNIAKVTELYTVNYPQGELDSEQSSESSKSKVSVVIMAELKTVKAKKIRTSPISALPKLSQKRLNCSVEPAVSITSRKSRSVGSRSCSYEKRSAGFSYENEEINGKSCKTIQAENKSDLNEKEKSMSNVSLGSVSPSKRQSQIPVLSRNSPKTRANRQKAASVGMISPKTVIISHGKTGQSRRTNNVSSNQSRSPSPMGSKSDKTRSADKINGRSRSYGSRSLVNNTVRRTGIKEGCTFDTDRSEKRTVAANNVSFNKSCTTITLCSPRADSDTPASEILTPHSQGNASSFTNEDLSPADIKDVCASASVSKESHEYDYNVEPCDNSECQRPHCSSEYSKLCQLNNICEDEPQLELLDLGLKDSESQLFSTVPGSTISSARKTASDDSLKFDDLQTPKTTIRTISGDELVLSSSMEFDIENDLKNNDLPNESEDTIKELLEKTEDDSFVKTYSGIQLIEDDSYEYDSEGTSDADIPSERKIHFGNGQGCSSRGRQSEHGMAESLESKVNWRSRKNELMTDIHYRQFLYHPAVMRRKSREGYRRFTEEKITEDRVRNKSTEDGDSFRISDDSEGEHGTTSKRGNFNSVIQDFDTERNVVPLRTRSDHRTEEEEREMYDRLNMMQNSEYVLKEMKRERTKRERITGAVLKITAKFIHLLAILNLWPGDNCQLLTSHTLRYGR